MSNETPRTSDDTTVADAPAWQSYRDLVHARADGKHVDDVRLQRWRREEQLIRSAVDQPLTYKNTGLGGAHFEAQLHAKAWQAILSLIAREEQIGGLFDELGRIPQPILIAELAEVDEALGGNHGSNYVAALMTESAVDPKYGLQVLAKELFQQHRNRRWHRAYQELGERIDRDRDIAGIGADFVRTSAGVVYEAQGDARVCKPVDQIEWDPREKVNDSLVRTGIEQIDRFAAGGHGRGELLVFGAGTSVGKSYSCQRILRAQARLKQRAAYISCEDPHELMYCRMIADFSEPPVTPAEIRKREADPEVVERAQQRMRDEFQGNIFMAVHKKPTITQVCELIRSHRYGKDVDLVIIDYLQAISADEPMQNKVQEMGMVTSTLKRTAYECDVALIAYSQLARDQYRDGAEPSINACKYCGDIENEAEIMVIMWRDADGVIHAKLPKIKWAAARDLRFIVPVHPVTGCHGQWSIDTTPPEDE